MLVVEQPDDLPLPPAPSNVNGYSKSAAGEAGEKRRAATAAVRIARCVLRNNKANKYTACNSSHK